MNQWWSKQEWFCKCQGDDRWVHVHYEEAPHSCARCSECSAYKPDIPEKAAINILIGPEMSNSEAADTLLGPAPRWQPIETAPKDGSWFWLRRTVPHHKVTDVTAFRWDAVYKGWYSGFGWWPLWPPSIASEWRSIKDQP